METEEKDICGRGTEKATEGYKLNPLYVETKSKRVQLVLQPSLYTKVKAAADAEGISFNEYCHRLLEEATREEYKRGVIDIVNFINTILLQNL